MLVDFKKFPDYSRGIQRVLGELQGVSDVFKALPWHVRGVSGILQKFHGRYSGFEHLSMGFRRVPEGFKAVSDKNDGFARRYCKAFEERCRRFQ